MLERVEPNAGSRTLAAICLVVSLGSSRMYFARRTHSLRPAARGTTYVSTVPSTVSDIFGAASASPAGVVRWGTPPAPPAPRTAPATGIYVVALTESTANGLFKPSRTPQDPHGAGS